jgi:hypothetical protein
VRLDLLRVQGVPTSGPRTQLGQRTGVEIRIPTPWYKIIATVRVVDGGGAANVKAVLTTAVAAMKQGGWYSSELALSKCTDTEATINLGHRKAPTGAHDEADRLAADVIAALNAILARR